MSSLAPIQAVSPSEAVVEAVADREDVEPTDLTPLYDAIDSEALDAVVESIDSHESTLRVAFEYHGYEVTVDADGVVRLDGVTSSPTRVA